MSDTGNKPPETTPPANVTQDDFKTFQTQITDTLASFKTSLEAVAAARNSAPNSIPVAEPEVKYDEIDKLITEGKPVGDTVAKMIEAAVGKAVKTNVNPSLNTGLQSLAGITLEVVKPQLKYYDRFKKEIDDAVKTFPAEARVNPEAYKIAHDAVVGRHTAELVKEAQEAAVRASRDNSATGLPGGESKNGGEKTPSWDEVFGSGASDALKHAGKHGSTPDEFAKRMGYKNADEYIKFTLDQRNGVSANA